jgi:hypothetical protein
VNKRTGNRVRHQLVDSVTGEAVAASEKGRGYEVDENQFLLVEDHDVEQARQTRPQPGALPLAEMPSAPVRPGPFLVPRHPAPVTARVGAIHASLVCLSRRKHGDCRGETRAPERQRQLRGGGEEVLNKEMNSRNLIDRRTGSPLGERLEFVEAC